MIDPHSYLDSEARIIAEDTTHAVIAVRVEKAFFARNLMLMAALSELISCPDEETVDVEDGDN